MPVQPKDFLIPGTLVIGLIVQTAYFSNNYGRMSERVDTIASDVAILKARTVPDFSVYDVKIHTLEVAIAKIETDEKDTVRDIRQLIDFNEAKNIRVREQLIGKGLIK